MKNLKLLITILSISICFNISSAEHVDDLDEKYLKVAALGRTAQIGQLYDVRTDSLRFSVIWKNSQEVPKIQQTDTPAIKNMVVNDTLKDKLTFLDIQDQLKLSVLSDMMKVEGPANVLMDKKESSRNAAAVLGVSIKTVYEQISFTDEDVRKQINVDVLKNEAHATHVVIGIQYGGRLVISVEQNVRDNFNVDDSLYARLENVCKSVSANGLANIKDKASDFKFKMYADFDTDSPIRNLADAVKLMARSSELVKRLNSGKGKPMSYALYPLHLLRQELSVKSSVDIHLKSIDKHTIDSGVQWFEDMHVVDEKVSELLDKRSKYENYIAKKKLDKLDEFIEKFGSYQSEMKASIKKCVVNIRTGIEKDDRLVDLLSKANIRKKFDFAQLSSIENEFNFLKSLANLHVHIIDKDTSFNIFLEQHSDKDIYAFFYSVDYPMASDGPLIAFKRILGERKKDAIFVVIKIDVLAKAEKETYFNFNGSTRLRMYKNRMKCRLDCKVDNVL